jgi:hypothetical protein
LYVENAGEEKLLTAPLELARCLLPDGDLLRSLRLLSRLKLLESVRLMRPGMHHQRLLSWLGLLLSRHCCLALLTAATLAAALPAAPVHRCLP